MTNGGPVHELAAALRAVRAAVAEAVFPLPLPSAAPARLSAVALLDQVDCYALPRVSHLDAPMLVVVGGSTGAGKSTLVNSLVQAPVSATGVLRPTTRSPVLVCHPADTPWFRGRNLLGRFGGRLGRGQSAPKLAGSNAGQRGGSGGDGLGGEAELQTIAAPALPQGVAFVDAPDIDSVVASNRALAEQLFDVADLWLFLTTPARYADAVPWELLHTARERGTVIALALARVPDGPRSEVVSLVDDLLAEQGLAGVPRFVLPETRVDGQGLLPESATEPLRGWFDGLAADDAVRAGVIQYTLDGALAAMPPRLAELAAAADEQLAAAESLAEQVGMAYGVARGTVERGVRDGVRPRTGAPGPRAASTEEWSRALKAKVGGWRDQLAALTGRSAGARHRQTEVETGLVTLVRSAATVAAEQTDSAWRGHPGAAALLASVLPGHSPELAYRIQRMARERHGDDLLERVGELLDEEASRWLERLAGAPLDGAPGEQLRQAAAELERARVAAQLTAGPATTPSPAAQAPPDPAGPEIPAGSVSLPRRGAAEDGAPNERPVAGAHSRRSGELL